MRLRRRLLGPIALADSPTRIDFVDVPAGVTTARIESVRTPAGGGSIEE